MTPVLCFTKAEVACYGRVGKVEVTTVGSLNRVLADPERPQIYGKGWEEYSPQEVRAISRFLEKRLGVSPAARPGAPPEEPSRTKRLLDWFFDLPGSTVFLGLLGVAGGVSLILPAQTSKLFLAAAYLYHLLAEIWRTLL